MSKISWCAPILLAACTRSPTTKEMVSTACVGPSVPVDLDDARPLPTTARELFDAALGSIETIEVSWHELRTDDYPDTVAALAAEVLFEVSATPIRAERIESAPLPEGCSGPGPGESYRVFADVSLTRVDGGLVADAEVELLGTTPEAADWTFGGLDRDVMLTDPDPVVDEVTSLTGDPGAVQVWMAFGSAGLEMEVEHGSTVSWVLRGSWTPAP